LRRGRDRESRWCDRKSNPRAGSRRAEGHTGLRRLKQGTHRQIRPVLKAEPFATVKSTVRWPPSLTWSVFSVLFSPNDLRLSARPRRSPAVGADRARRLRRRARLARGDDLLA